LEAERKALPVPPGEVRKLGAGGLLVDLVDLGELKNHRHRQLRLHPDPHSLDFLNDEFSGSRLLLSRVLGHKELLQPRKPLFSAVEVEAGKQFVEQFVAAENKAERLRRPAVEGAEPLYVSELKHTPERAVIREKFLANIKDRSEAVTKLAEERYNCPEQ